MIKVNYDKLSDAVQDYEGYCKEDFKQLPYQVWEALDDYFDRSEIDVDSLSEFFDNLYLNDLCIEDANEVDKDNHIVLYVNEDNMVYYLE